MSASTPPAHTISLREAAAFFLPLIFMAQLMMISHTVIHAWLARGSFPTESLAAFSIAFALNALLSSIFRSMHQIALSFGSDRASFGRVWNFGIVMAVASTGTILAVAFTPLGDWVYGGLLGAGPLVVRDARAASAIFAFIYPLQCTRNVAAGLLMVHRHTLLISYGTAVRLLSLGALLVALSGTLSGASLGSAALVGCIAVEMTFVMIFAAPFYRRLPASAGPPPGYGEIWRFSWPLIANAMLENGLIVLVNAFVGRLENADLNLAAFGVARGLLMLMMSPLRNLAQTAQALTQTRADLGQMIRFSRFATAGFMALIVLLFYTPLRGIVLGRVMGLSPALQAAVEPAVLLFVITPPLWALSSAYRGLLARARQTAVLAATGTLRLGAVLAISSVCLAWPQANGAVVGVLALAGAFLGETVWLGRSLRGYLRDGVAFPEEDPRAGGAPLEAIEPAR
jgi:progressive ankylosis protein